MNRLERSPLYGSVVALALTAVALLVSLLLRPYLEPDIFLLFLVAGVAERLVLRTRPSDWSRPARPRLRCLLLLFRRSRIPGAGRAARVVPGDRGRDRLDDRGMAGEPSRAGLHAGGHRRRACWPPIRTGASRF